MAKTGLNRIPFLQRVFYLIIIVVWLAGASCGVPPASSTPGSVEPFPATVAPAFVVFPTTESLASKTYEVATAYSNQFQASYNIQLNPALAVGLDGKLISEGTGVLVSTLAPAADANQYIEGKWQVFGYLGFDSNTQPRVKELDSRSAYLIACQVDTKECIAVPETGEQISIAAEYDFLPQAVEVPFAEYEEGSIKACFILVNVRVCVVIF